MSGHECYHCGQWIEAGTVHDCWTTTEAALTRDLPEEIREAWQRLRATAAAFGDQRIYASHHCIMFSRGACYFFVRPRTTALEVCIFLGRSVAAPQIRRVRPVSRTKTSHMLRITHRDEVEPPITEWLREAYDVSDALTAQGRTKEPKSKGGARRAPKGTKARDTATRARRR